MHIYLYRSRARPGLAASDLNAIINVAQRTNAEIDVTGLLLYGDIPMVPGAPGEFVQWIEGPRDALDALYASIQADPRHFDVETLAQGAPSKVRGRGAATRLFPSWSMGLVRLSELPATRLGFLEFARAWDGATLETAL